jgi:hypothetical protein
MLTYYKYIIKLYENRKILNMSIGILNYKTLVINLVLTLK